MWAKKTEFALGMTFLLILGMVFQGIAAGISGAQAVSPKSPWEGKIPLVTQLDTMELVSKGYQRAVFAGGCFWCMQGPFDVLEGVKLTRAGYAGGTEVNPKYQDVSYGRTSHTEAVEIWFDSTQITYDSLLQVFWRSMDPTDLDGQFADRGKQYRPSIFYMNADQAKQAQASKSALEQSKRFRKPIIVPIEPYKNFYPAEEYHQFYYLKNPPHYKRYRVGSGREGFLKKYWAK